MKIYELSKINGLGYYEPDYDAIFNSGYTAGYEVGYNTYSCPVEKEDE